MSPYMNDILIRVWECLVQSSNVYLETIVNCSKENRNESFDNEGNRNEH